MLPNLALDSNIQELAIILSPLNFTVAVVEGGIQKTD